MAKGARFQGLEVLHLSSPRFARVASRSARSCCRQKSIDQTRRGRRLCSDHSVRVDRFPPGVEDGDLDPGRWRTLRCGEMTDGGRLRWSVVVAFR